MSANVKKQAEKCHVATGGVDGWVGHLIERLPGVAGADRSTEFSNISNSGRVCKTCTTSVGKSFQYCPPCRDRRRKASIAASHARQKAERPPSVPRPRRVVTNPADQVWPVSPATSGAIAELMVAADLLRRGFHVFRAVSPSCPCDLLVMRDNLSARVEVRKVVRRADGKLARGCDAAERDRFDVLARVEMDGTIHYTGMEKVGF